MFMHNQLSPITVLVCCVNICRCTDVKTIEKLREKDMEKIGRKKLKKFPVYLSQLDVFDDEQNVINYFGHKK